MTKKEIYLVLDNIRSRENVGSIFRTADAAGVAKIYLCGITPTPKTNNESRIMNQGREPKNHNSKFIIHNSEILPIDRISKTALGAETYMPWEYYKQAWRLLEMLKKSGINIVALEQTKKSVDLFKYKPAKNKKIALVVGNEVKGLSPKILKYCDEIVHIPMCGRKESLNVSVAFGVAVYQLIFNDNGGIRT